MKRNPYYDKNMKNDCREYMILSIKLWLAYLEKNPEQVAPNSIFSVNEVAYAIENANELTTREIATMYEIFVECFSLSTETLEKLFKVPILFLVPEI